MHASGFIHGRFQVVHNDHLKYLLAGKALCKHLTVGITNPDAESTRDEASDPHRSDARNNPLTYGEREAMIRAALTEAGVPETDFDVVPFPICRPEQIATVAPKDAVYYLTIYDDWGREKLKRFKSLGLTTHVMWERPLSEKGLTGNQVREAIRSARDYRSLVPPAVAELVKKWKLQERFSGTSPSGS